MSKNYTFYLNNSILKQYKYPNAEIKRIIFRNPYKFGKTEIVCFNFTIESEKHTVNVNGSLSEFNNKVSLNYTDGRNNYSDYFEYSEEEVLLRKSMIIYSEGNYEIDEDIIEEKKYILERK